MNRWILLFFHIVSLFLLGFGWVKNMLEIDISAHFLVDINLFNEKRSVISTLQSLWNSSNFWPFILIFLFGIIVPLIKSAIIFYLIFSNKPKQIWYKMVSNISKWAMADVFVISIFIAFLGAKAMENTKANLLEGFYYFSSYVLLSGIIVMFLPKMIKSNEILNT